MEANHRKVDDVTFLDDFTKGYIRAALWSSNDDEEVPLDENYDYDDLTPRAFYRMLGDCIAFQQKARCNGRNPIVFDTGWEESRAGHDFWLTRNGHGAGFWDGDWGKTEGDLLTAISDEFGECNLYVTDDGKVDIM